MTVYQAVGLCDDVTVAPSPGWTLGVTVPDWIDADAVPVTGDNIVDRAARLLAEHHGIASQAAVSIAKSIPVAGGMAGGSADAAAALVALDRLWELQTSDDDLLAIAAELGQRRAVRAGRRYGARHRPRRAGRAGARPGHVVVGRGALGRRGCRRRRSTGASTSSRPTRPRSRRAPTPSSLALATGDPEILAGALHNDLEAAALDLRPDLADLLELGERSGALRGLVSGSGPTCLFLDRGRRRGARASPAGCRSDHDVVLVTNGPVAGAHVVTYA